MFDSYIVSNTKTSLSMPLCRINVKLKNKKNLKHFAFTLAETLITLTIIGVIAALTVPNLINNYKKQQVETGIKTAYSILSNAVKMTEAQYGSINELITLNEKQITTYGTKETFADAFLPNLKLSNRCKNPYSCTLNEMGLNSRHIKNFDGSISTGQSWDLQYMRRVTLANGMHLFIGALVESPAIVFHVDINGNEGPRTFGKDVFSFALFRSDVQNRRYTAPNNALYGGFTGYGYYEHWLNKSKEKCETHGFYCTKIIQKNGWKIPDDYPVKKW